MLLPSSVHSILTEPIVVGRVVAGAAGVVGGQSRLGSATNWSAGTRENHWPPSPCLFPTIRAPPHPLSLATQASRALLPNCVSKMSPCFGLATLHSVNPPTANGFPVATLISMFPDSDHFHSWLSAPVKDHISSLFAPAWTTLPVVSKGRDVPGIFQGQSDLMTNADQSRLPR